MSGKPGRSGRRPTKTIEQHLLARTYRADRHGPRPSGAVILDGPFPAPWTPDETMLAALTVRARVWAQAVSKLYRLSETDGLLLLECCRVLSLIERLETSLASAIEDDGAGGRRAIERSLDRARRTFIAQSDSLKLPTRTTARSVDRRNPFAHNGVRPGP